MKKHKFFQITTLLLKKAVPHFRDFFYKNSANNEIDYNNPNSLFFNDNSYKSKYSIIANHHLEKVNKQNSKKEFSYLIRSFFSQSALAKKHFCHLLLQSI